MTRLVHSTEAGKEFRGIDQNQGSKCFTIWGIWLDVLHDQDFRVRL